MRKEFDYYPTPLSIVEQLGKRLDWGPGPLRLLEKTLLGSSKMSLDQILAIRETLLLAKDAQNTLSDAIDLLEKRDAKAIREHFFEGVPMTEIAARMPHSDKCNCVGCCGNVGPTIGVSPTRVSQIIDRGIRSLRQTMLEAGWEITKPKGTIDHERIFKN